MRPLGIPKNAMTMLTTKTTSRHPKNRKPIPRTIFLATDESDFHVLLSECTAALEAADEGRSMRIISQGDGVFRNYGERGMAFHLEKQQKPQPQDGGDAPHQRAFIEVATDIMLLAQSEYLIGSFSNTVNVAARLRWARFIETGGQPPPHKAIAVPLVGRMPLLTA